MRCKLIARIRPGVYLLAVNETPHSLAAFRKDGLAAAIALLVIACRNPTFAQSVEDPAKEAKDEGLPAENSCRIPGVTYPIGITYEELVAGLDADALVLIDVRDPLELRETGKLPKSHNVPLPEFETAFQLSPEEFTEKYGFPKPTPQDENVVLSCQSGCRIVTAWEAIQPFGYCRVRLYYGSFLDWESRHGPLIKENKEELFLRSMRSRWKLVGHKWLPPSSSGKTELAAVLVVLAGAGVSFSMTIRDGARGDLASEDGESFKNASCRIPGITYPIGIEFEELAEGLLNDSVVLIDVRNRWELEETGKLPKSQNVPLPEFETAFNLSPEEFLKKYGFIKPEPEDENVVLTCRSGRRILLAWDAIEPLGYCKVRLYFGSYLDWKARSAPLIPVPGSLEP
ncbi:uncharacterized protein LOC119574829 [Penaeus monodon]|uniref:uncharacterized protein LOC119574829 n=1 Tax=Penaeus monodon TaxID=6687 RepID=UPI0018A7C358|nr:uncharacterized protein LOC119574829 [Penaeus monodon]